MCVESCKLMLDARCRHGDDEKKHTVGKPQTRLVASTTCNENILNECIIDEMYILECLKHIYNAIKNNSTPSGFFFNFGSPKRERGGDKDLITTANVYAITRHTRSHS